MPSNAQAFRLHGDFFSVDYPEFVCTTFNDTFVALLDSQATSNPADKNLAVTLSDGGEAYPMNVNVTLVGDLFRVCQNSCTATPPNMVYTSCVSDAELIGTGFDTADAQGCPPPAGQFGAGTGWMAIQGNVVGGEIITLRLAIWDNGDGIFDSVVLLDGLEWLPEPVTAGAFAE